MLALKDRRVVAETSVVKALVEDIAEGRVTDLIILRYNLNPNHGLGVTTPGGMTTARQIELLEEALAQARRAKAVGF